jgi:hypothetical protein
MKVGEKDTSEANLDIDKRKKATLKNSLDLVKAEAWSMDVGVLVNIKVAYSIEDVIEMLARHPGRSFSQRLDGHFLEVGAGAGGLRANCYFVDVRLRYGLGDNADDAPETWVRYECD